MCQSNTLLPYYNSEQKILTYFLTAINDDETRDNILNEDLHKDECNNDDVHQFLLLLKRSNGFINDNEEEMQESEWKQVVRK